MGYKAGRPAGVRAYDQGQRTEPRVAKEQSHAASHTSHHASSKPHAARVPKLRRNVLNESAVHQLDAKDEVPGLAA